MVIAVQNSKSILVLHNQLPGADRGGGKYDFLA
jgi:hypothetical protein